MIAAIDFVDLQDNNYLYHAGDTFPRNGKEVDAGRVAELSGSDNAMGRPIIVEKVDKREKPKAAEKPVEKPAGKPVAKRRKKND